MDDWPYSGDRSFSPICLVLGHYYVDGQLSMCLFSLLCPFFVCGFGMTSLLYFHGEVVVALSGLGKT